MEIKIKDAKLERAIKIFIFTGISLILAGFTFLFLKVNDLSRKVAGLSLVRETQMQSIAGTCGQDCREQIRQAVSEAVATISSYPKFSSPTLTSPIYKTVYIPLGSSGSTQSTDWVTVDGTGAFVDAKNEYGPNVNISWDAFLSVDNSNGQTFARLWDDTHKIAVNGSEISVTATSSPTLVSSGNLNFWVGRNLYKVQIKSLTSFTAYYSGGRIRINF